MCIHKHVTLYGWQDGKVPQAQLAQEEVVCQGITVACLGPILAQGELISWCALGSVMLR